MGKNDNSTYESRLEIDKNEVQANKISSNVVSSGQNYSVSVGDLHTSETISPISATLFLFNSDEGISESSEVVGPSKNTNPEFEYDQVNYLPLVDEIDNRIKSQGSTKVLLSLEWMRKIHILEHAHRLESIKFKNYSVFLSWSTIVIPAVMSAIALYLRLKPDTIETGFSLVLLALLAGLSTLTGTILKFKNPGDLSERHRENSERFEQLRHKLEQYITFNNDGQLEKYLDSVREEWSQLTLLNVDQKNYKKAAGWINQFDKYPNKLDFVENRK